MPRGPKTSNKQQPNLSKDEIRLILALTGDDKSGEKQRSLNVCAE